MSEGFGFKKKKKNASLGAAELARKVKPPKVSDEKEAEAIRVGEAKGFVTREQAPEPIGKTPPSMAVPNNPVGQRIQGRAVRRRKVTEPRGNLLVTGPQRVLDSFVEFADRNEYPSYWTALEALLTKAK